MRRKGLLIVAIIMISLLTMTFGQMPQSPGRTQQSRSSQLIDYVLENKDTIGVSEEQAENLKEIENELNEKMNPLREKSSQVQSTVKELMDKDEKSKEKIFEHIDKASEINAEIQKARVDFQIDFENILTDEQLTTMQNLLRQRSQRRMKSRQQMPPRGR